MRPNSPPNCPKRPAENLRHLKYGQVWLAAARHISKPLAMMIRTPNNATVADDRIAVDWHKYCASLHERGHRFTDKEAGFYLARIKAQPNLFNALQIAKRKFEQATAPLSACQRRFADEYGLTPSETRRQFAVQKPH